MSGRTPMDEIERMFEQMSRQFEDASRQWQSLGRTTMGSDSAAADVVDRGDEFEVVVELPGFDAEDVDVRLVGRTLSLQARRSEESSMEDEQFVRHERSQRSVSRQIELPEPVDADDVRATLDDGLLTLTIPKATAGQGGQSIDIE